MQGTTVREVKEVDIGWLAGIIDGEANVCFVKNQYNRLMHKITIINSNIDLLNKCLWIINKYSEKNKDIKIHVKKYKTGIFKSNKKMYDLTIHRQNHLKNILPVLIPHLTEKKLKSQQLLNFLENHKKGTWFKDGEVDKYLSFTPAETK
jgi:hypothetical protein